MPLAPIPGLALTFTWHRLPATIRPRVLTFLTTATLVGLSIALSPWCLHGVWPQAIALAICYVASICLTAIALRRQSWYAGTASQTPLPKRTKRRRLLRFIAALAAPAMCFGLVAFWAHHDTIDSATSLGDHVVLYRSSGGFAGIDWEGVTLIQHSSALPFLDHTLYRIHLGDTGDCDVKCAHVEVDARQRQYVVSYGPTRPFYVFARVNMP